MSWLDDLFKNPKLGYSPNLEPPGWNLMRDMLMRKIFNLQSNPYGYDPSKGQSMESLLPSGGRGMFDPYGGAGIPGGGGQGGGMPGGAGRPTPVMAQPGPRDTRVVQRPLGTDARGPVVPPGPYGGGMGNPAPGGSNPMRPQQPQQPQQQAGQQPTAPARGGPGGRRDTGTNKQKDWWQSDQAPWFVGQAPFSDTFVAPPTRPDDANPDILPRSPGGTAPEYQGPPREGGDPNAHHHTPTFDGQRLGYDSPYMFQRGPRMLGSDSPPYISPSTPPFDPNQRRMRFNPYQQSKQAYFGGDPGAMLRAMGFNFNQGPQAGTMFNRGGQSYFNQGSSHEGAGPGGQSQFLQAQGFQGSPGGGYGGQLGMVDKMMADVAQQNLRNRVGQLTPADKAAMSASGKDIFGGSAMGVPGGAHGTPGTGVDWRKKPPAPAPAAPSVPGYQPAPAPPPTRATTQPGRPGAAPQAPTVSGYQPAPATGTLREKETREIGRDAMPTMPTQPPGAPPTETDPAVMQMLMGLLQGGGGMMGGGGGTGQGSMPMMDPRLQRKRPMGF